ncbi:MAG TPA: hypothetical protein PKC28_01690 [Bdellovibrionales bacterium]|nr:hypothetical protein [Bdellovibrionales bacterium]
MTSQPATVRERATSADLIVSHYLQARRKHAAQMEAPVSGETFKADLKHLAEDLKQFEDPSAPPHPAPSRSPSHGPFDFEPVHHQQRTDTIRVEAVRTETTTQHAPAPETSRGPVWHVDPRSLAAARELQARFNLGSEVEALRMLVTLGIERAKEMCPF